VVSGGAAAKETPLPSRAAIDVGVGGMSVTAPVHEESSSDRIIKIERIR
jgi:hypothetical protein